MGNLWAGVLRGGYSIVRCWEGKFGKLQGSGTTTCRVGIMPGWIRRGRGSIFGEFPLGRQNGIKWRYFGT